MTERMRLNEGNRRWWTLAAMCFALFMIMLDNTVVNVALPSIQKELGASLPGARVDGQHLHADLRRPARDRRAARGHPRTPADVPLRRRRVRGVQRGDRPCARPGLADRRPRHPGRGRGVHDARHALDHHRDLPPARARQGHRDVGRRVRARAGDRPSRGRCSDPVRLLASDLLPEPAGGRRRRGRDPVRGARVARRDHRALDRLARHRDALGRAHRARPRADRGQLVGLGLA